MSEGAATSIVNWFLAGTPYEAANWLAPLDAVPAWARWLVFLLVVAWWFGLLRHRARHSRTP